MIELKFEELSLVSGGRVIQPDFGSYAGNALFAGALGAKAGPVGALGSAGTSLVSSIVVDAVRSLPVNTPIPKVPVTPEFRTPTITKENTDNSVRSRLPRIFRDR